MNITALSFFASALVFILLYWALPPRFRPAWLLAGSLAFLATWSWQFILVLLVLGTVNFLLGRALGMQQKLGSLHDPDTLGLHAAVFGTTNTATIRDRWSAATGWTTTARPRPRWAPMA